MSRQRTISDQRFWRSPCLNGCTTEDKIALLHLLTCPDSNVVGAYPLVPRIAGAEIGWTAEQWLYVMERLKAADLAWYDSDRMYVWVRIWWEHHQATQVMGPKLRSRTLDDIKRLPELWYQPFLNDLRKRVSEEHQKVLDEITQGKPREDTISIPYPYGIDTISNFSRLNTNNNINLTLTTTLGGPPSHPVDNSAIPAEHRSIIEAAIAKAEKVGVAKVDAKAVWHAMSKNYRSKHPPHDPGGLAYYLMQNLRVSGEGILLPSTTPEELKALEGRCFQWPEQAIKAYIRFCEGGCYDYYGIENGKLVHRLGYAEYHLLKSIREERLKEVSLIYFDEFASGCVT